MSVFFLVIPKGFLKGSNDASWCIMYQDHASCIIGIQAAIRGVDTIHMRNHDVLLGVHWLPLERLEERSGQFTNFPRVFGVADKDA